MEDFIIKRVFKELPYDERIILYKILDTELEIPDNINHSSEISILEYLINPYRESIIVQYLDSYNNRSSSLYDDIIRLIDSKYNI